jgi:hypothetical protein
VKYHASSVLRHFGEFKKGSRSFSATRGKINKIMQLALFTRTTLTKKFCSQQNEVSTHTHNVVSVRLSARFISGINKLSGEA